MDDDDADSTNVCVYLKALAKHDQSVIFQLWGVKAQHSMCLPPSYGNILIAPQLASMVWLNPP